MPRWRPPSPRSSPYITPAGMAALRAELDVLWLRRREVTAHLAAAAAEGDRSENAEYIYRKKELRELDRRIRYLQKRLPDLQVVAHVPDDRLRIFFGARVRLEDEDGRPTDLRIVGADELDTARNWISVDSPMARALLKHTLDDEVCVRTPGGARRYRVVAVEYDDAARLPPEA
ncbi:transcription elongation factor GreB [Acidihalobacter ferrooxydans]|uniref:Transcription elongation factor GreB n=2 Tax=Acidihalobacter ferrooxydans TaxID=1765967 RepID=A0A1P8ULS7_9GAMM|nr:transcription elongation factor GreB [Acidihalobacter ferrooxydans]